MAAPVPPPSPHEAEPSAARVLRIVSGVHAGAVRPLAAQEMLLIGRGDDCDLVLSDPDVAPHHALLTVMGGSVLLRAIDAPVRLGHGTLRPGDPVELPALQRVSLGSAAFAVGEERDPGWSLLAETEAAPGARARRTRHLPWVAALAALSLVSVAIFAAVMPPRSAREPVPAVRAQRALNGLGVAGLRVEPGADGSVTVHGTVNDTVTRERIRQRLRAEGIAARVEVRTGDDIASDVREVLRSQGLVARTRWLGNGDVEIVGRFEDETALRQAATSRAMREVVGVRRVIPRNLVATAAYAAPRAGGTAAPSRQEELVEVVHGDDPHVVAADGTQYRIGATLPSGRTLVAIGRQVWVMDGGQVVPVKLVARTQATAPAPAAPATAQRQPGALAAGARIAPGRTTVRM